MGTGWGLRAGDWTKLQVKNGKGITRVAHKRASHIVLQLGTAQM